MLLHAVRLPMQPREGPWCRHTCCLGGGMRACQAVLLGAALLLALLLLPSWQPVSGAPHDLATSQEYLQLEAKLRAELAGHQDELSIAVVNARLQLATVLQSLNYLHPDGGSRIREAEALYRSALEMIPESEPLCAAVHGNLGALLLEAFRPAEALEEIDKAIALVSAVEGGDGGLAFNRAKALGILGRIEEANKAYVDAAHDTFGKDLSSFAKSAAGAEWLSDDLLKKVQATAAEAADAAAAAAAVTAGRPSAHAGEGWLAAAAAAEISWLNFAASKALHHRKNYARAFEALTLANAYMRSTLPAPYSAHSERRHLDTIKTVFNGNMQIAGGYEDPSPVFVVGMPRSGSTLVESILASHSQVWGAGEDTALMPLAAELNRRTTDPDLGGVITSLGKSYVEAMYAMVPPSMPRPARIVDKMLRNLWHVGYIDLMLPGAKVVHVMRHPLDAGLSCYQQPFSGHSLSWAWDLRDIGTQLNFTHEIAQHWDDVLPGRVKTVLYEELVAYPRELAQELLEFVGLPWEDGVMEFHKAERVVATASVTQVRKPMYQTSVARWRRYKDELSPLVETLGGTVAAYEERMAAVLSKRAEQAQHQQHQEL